MISSVAFFLADIQDNVVAQTDGIVKVRQLIHYIYQRSVEGATDDAYSTQTGIPLAIAASISLLREGSRADLEPYAQQMRLSLGEFERKGPVPPINSGGTPGSDPPPPGPDIPLGFDAAHPDWVCAAAAPRVLSTAQNYALGTATGRDLMVAMLSEKNRCDLRIDRHAAAAASRPRSARGSHRRNVSGAVSIPFPWIVRGVSAGAGLQQHRQRLVGSLPDGSRDRPGQLQRHAGLGW